MGAASHGIALLLLTVVLIVGSLADRFAKVCGQKFGDAREIYQSDGIYVSLLSFRGQQAVIKEARKESSQALKDSIKQEMEILKSLPPHMNVIQMYAYCDAPDSPFYIMEYASNRSLRSFIKRRLIKGGGVALSRQELLDLLRGIAAGMAHVQAQRVVHNDLSARNIFLDSNNIPKIADFGYATKLPWWATSTPYDPHHPINRTLAWLAPESLVKPGRIHLKTDVWSFGIVMIQLAGRLEPFPAKDEELLGRLIATGTVSPFKAIHQRNGAKLKIENFALPILRKVSSYFPGLRPNFAWISKKLSLIQ